MERIKASGGNPFGEYSLPEAILKFKQGFGRLIRSRQDHGSVVVLDSRIVSKFYGKKFIAALPGVPVKRAGAQLPAMPAPRPRPDTSHPPADGGYGEDDDFRETRIIVPDEY